MEHSDLFQVDENQLERICKAALSVDDSATNRPIDALVYDEPFEPGCFKLIEVTESIAEKVLRGEAFYVSGDKDDQLVFCTNDQTFQAKEVERSNSMIITNLSAAPNDFNEQTIRRINVSSLLCRNFELIEAPFYKPSKFRELLNSRQVNLFNDEPKFPSQSLSLQQFMSAFPLCESQVQRLLSEYPVFEINNSIFCLSANGQNELMSEFAGFLDDQSSLSLRRSDLENSSIFSDINTRYSSTVVGSLVDWMLRSFFDSEDGTTFIVNCERTGREFCSHILRKYASGNFMDLDDLERHFYRLVPGSMQFNVKLLKGIGFLKKPTNSSVTFLSSELLPLDSQKRLEKLWSLSDSWTLEEIEPYILDFVGDSKSILEFMASRCRVNNLNGQTVFHRL
ncbi:hypothetical protein M3Y94_00813900 [Aphelenchoides besseyi]|nr:hypothetical protein M3Y94_00813900 [Aphelenchoides besseyi]KAI6227181.1 Sister chromatid cohesion protein DCC1 [Aphelenchoides besseyi]